MERLLGIFCERVQPTLPFIATLPLCPSSGTEKKPTFLRMACAALGAVLSREPELTAWARNIWMAALDVHSASIEVDNSLARSVDWTASVSSSSSTVMSAQYD